MKRLLIAAGLLAFVAVHVEAADAMRWRMSILAAELSEKRADYPWSEVHGGVGLAIAYSVNPQWDAELSVAKQSHTSPYVLFLPFPPSGTVPVTEFRQYDVYPVSLAVTRHLRADSRIDPYVRAGVRYIDGPDSPPTPPVPPSTIPGAKPVKLGYFFSGGSRTSLEAGAGVLVRITPRTAIRAEIMRLLREEETAYDPFTRAAVGLSWKL